MAIVCLCFSIVINAWCHLKIKRYKAQQIHDENSGNSLSMMEKRNMSNVVTNICSIFIMIFIFLIAFGINRQSPSYYIKVSKRLAHRLCWEGQMKQICLMLGSGCGSVGRAVASDTRGPQFESSHWQKFDMFIKN